MGLGLGSELEAIRRGDVALLGGDAVRHGFDRRYDECTFLLGEDAQQLEHPVVAPPEPQASIEQGVTGAARIVGLQRASNTPADSGELCPGCLQGDLPPQLVIRRFATLVTARILSKDSLPSANAAWSAGRLLSASAARTISSPTQTSTPMLIESQWAQGRIPIPDQAPSL